MNTFVAVAVGGALGAVSRYSFGLVALALIGNRFPWATLGVNVVGSFLIGLAAVLIGDRIVDGELWRPLIIVGFLGAFTTFSAFSLDTLFANKIMTYVALTRPPCIQSSPTRSAVIFHLADY